MKKDAVKFPKEIMVWQDHDDHNPEDKWYVVETDLNNLSGDEGEIAVYSLDFVKKVTKEIVLK